MAAYGLKEYSNIAIETTLVGDITDESTTISIAASTGWSTGASGSFYIQIENEVIEIDERSSNTLTVAANGRGADGTTAAAHTSGVTVKQVFVANDATEANKAVAELIGQATAVGQIPVVDAVNSYGMLQAKGDGKVLIGNGTTVTSQSISGDATLTNAGVLTLVATAVRDIVEPIGSCKIIFGSTFDTDVYFECDGSEKSRTTYADLYDALGGASSPWGQGNGTTTFNLPDLQSRVMMGAGQGSGLTQRDLGDYVGEEEHTLTGPESGIAEHTHIQNSHNHTQDSHNHTQNAHTHIQDAHLHSESSAQANALAQSGVGQSVVADGTSALTDAATATNQSTTATNNATTATNQAATATNQNAGPTNAAEAHNNIQPSAVVTVLIRHT